MEELRIIVSEAAFRDALCEKSTDLKAETPEDGFGETLYPVLVDVGLLALPASMLASMIAAWLVDVAKGQGTWPVVGFESGTRSKTIELSDADVDRIAARLRELLTERELGDDDKA